LQKVFCSEILRGIAFLDKDGGMHRYNNSFSAGEFLFFMIASPVKEEGQGSSRCGSEGGKLNQRRRFLV
jgi:hypothetical protein